MSIDSAEVSDTGDYLTTIGFSSEQGRRLRGELVAAYSDSAHAQNGLDAAPSQAGAGVLLWMLADHVGNLPPDALGGFAPAASGALRTAGVFLGAQGVGTFLGSLVSRERGNRLMDHVRQVIDVRMAMAKQAPPSPPAT